MPGANGPTPASNTPKTFTKPVRKYRRETGLPHDARKPFLLHPKGGSKTSRKGTSVGPPNSSSVLAGSGVR
jgi:hypothetical protein